MLISAFSERRVQGPAGDIVRRSDQIGRSLRRRAVMATHDFFLGAATASGVRIVSSRLQIKLDRIPAQLALESSQSLNEHGAPVENVPRRVGATRPLDSVQPFGPADSTHTVEHLDFPQPAGRQLLPMEQRIVSSTTFETPTGLTSVHIQSPIHLKSARSSIQSEFDSSVVCCHPNQETGDIRQSRPAQRAA